MEILEDRTLLAFNLTITAAASAFVTIDDTVPGLRTITANATAATVNVADILAGFTLGRNVTVDTGAAGAESGTITWAATANLDYNGIAATRTLTFQAGATAAGTVTLDSNLTDSVPDATDAVNFTINSGGTITFSALAPVIALASGTLTLNPTAGGVTQTAGTLTGTNLLFTGAGTFTVDQATNNFVTAAANVTGALTYRDTNALTIGTVSTTVGIDTNGNNVTLTTGGLLTIGAGAGEDITTTGATLDLNVAGISQLANSIITTDLFRLQGVGTFTLDQANDFGTVAANVTGALTLVDADDLTIGSVLTTIGITTGGNTVNVTASTSLTVSQAVNASAAAVTLAADAVGGATIQLDAAITGSTVTVNGGAGADAFQVNVTGGSALTLNGLGGADTYTIALNGLGTAVTISDSGAAGPTDQAIVNASAGNDTVTLNATSLTRTSPATPAVSFDGNLEALTLNLLGGDDSVTVTPGASPAFTLDGGPTTNDTLIVNAGGATVSTDATTITVGVNPAITYANFETVTANNAADQTLTGTGGDDVLTLVRQGNDLRATLGTTTYVLTNGATAAGFAFVFNAGLGNDRFTVDFTNGTSPIPLGGITYDGEGPGVGPGDMLRLLGAATFDVTYTPSSTTAGAGTFTVGTGVIDFTGLEPVDVTGFGTFSLTLPNANDIVTVQNDFDFFTGAIPALRLSGTSGGIGFETAAVWNVGTVIIDTTVNDGNDTITITSANNAHTNVNFTVTTGAGTDTVTVNGSMLFSGNVTITTVGINLNNNISTNFGAATSRNVTLTGAVILGANVTINTDHAALADGNVTFVGTASTINGAFTLTLTAGGGTIDIQGAIGGTTPLTGLTTNSTAGTRIGADITTVAASGDQTYNSPVVLTVPTVTLSGNDITFNGTVNSDAVGTPRDLVVNTNNAGITIFAAAVGGAAPLASLTTNADGTTQINGGAVTTTGGQTYNDPVTLGAATLLTSTLAGTVRFATTLNGASALTVNTSGSTIFDGIVGGGTALTSLTTDAPGSTQINGGAVTTTGGQTYNDPVTLGAAVTLLTSTLAGTIRFAATLNGASTLTVNTSGSTIFDGIVGGGTALTSLTTDALGSTQINGGAVTTTGNQTYNDPVTLGANTTLNGNNITFSSTVNSDATPRTLAVNTSGGGLTTFNGIVGGAAPLAGLTTNADGTTRIRANISTTATGDQTYNDAVELGATPITLSGNDLTFNSTVNSDALATPRALIVISNTGGVTAFNGPVGSVFALLSLATNADGTSGINGGSVTTTTFQSYGDPVTLGANTILNGTDVFFGNTLNSAGANRDLTVNASGVTTFTGAVGAGLALASLTTDAGGSTVINGGSVNTTGNQTYGDPVTLGANTTLNGNNITFNSTVNSDATPRTLAVNTSGGGLTTFNGIVGGTAPLAGLTTNADGTTRIRANISTTATGDQTYNDAVELGATPITLTGNDITFNGTVNSDALVTPRALIVNSNTGGVTAFNGPVGGVFALLSLATNADGVTGINGGSVTTTTFQSYGDPVTLGADTTLNGTDVFFGNTLNSAGANRNLTVNASAVTTFSGAVGSVLALASLTTSAPGSTVINGGAITTTGNQTYNDAVTLGANTTLNGNNITFNNRLNADALATPRSLIVNSGGNGVTAFNGTVGDTFPLLSLTTNADGATGINGGSVVTTGDQSYGDLVVLGANTTLTGVNVTFSSLLNSAGVNRTLLVNASGVTTFGGAVGTALALASLTTNAAGSTAINGGTIVSSGDQTYNDPVTLGADTVLIGVNVTFAATLNSSGAARALSVTASGTTTFGGFVGGTLALASLLTDAPGTTAVNGGGVTTTGNQTYNDPVTLGVVDATLNTTAGGNVTFNSTINGARNLTINAGTGAVTFNGVIGGTTPLLGLTVNTNNTGGLTITQNITVTMALILNVGANLTIGPNLTINAGAGTVSLNIGSATAAGTIADLTILPNTVITAATTTANGRVGGRDRITVSGRTNQNNTYMLTSTGTIGSGTVTGTGAVSGAQFAIGYTNFEQLVINGATGFTDVLTITNPAASLVTLAGLTAPAAGTLPSQLTSDNLGILYNGNGPVAGGRDSLTLTGGGGADFTTRYSPGPGNGDGTYVTGNSAGTIVQRLRFTGLAPITDTVAAGTLIVDATNAANAIFLENAAAATQLRVRIDAFETVDFANKTNLVINAFDPVNPAGDAGDTVTLNFTQVATGLATVTINGGVGNETFLVQAVPAAAGTITTITLNGDDGTETFNIQATLAGATTVVNGGAGNDTVNVSSDAPTNNGTVNAIVGALTVNGDAGTNTLNLSDRGTAAASTHTLTATTYQRLGTAVVTYGAIQTVNLSADTGGDTINVQSTAAGTTYTVNANAGNDIINVGNAANQLDGILGVITLNGDAGTDTVNFNDQGTAAASTYTLTATTFQRNGTAVVTYATTETLVLNAGTGGDTINVQGTAAGTTYTVNGNAGNDTVNVGNLANRLDDIQGTLTVNGNAGTNTLNVNDQGNPTGSTYTVTNSTVQRTGTALITYGTTQTVNLNAGMGGDTINVQGTASGTAYTVNANAGNDTVNVSNAANRVDDIQGAVTINGDAGMNTLNVNDRGTAAASTHTLTATTYQRNGTAVVTYATTQTVNLFAGTGGDTINVQGTLAGTAYTVNAGASNDTIIVTNLGGTLDNIAGALAVNGESETDTLTITDSGTTTNRRYEITNTFIQRNNTARITYATTEIQNLNAGSGNDAIVTLSTPVGTTTNLFGSGGNDSFSLCRGIAGRTNVNGGDGSDQFALENTANLQGGIIDGGAGVNTLNYSGVTPPGTIPPGVFAGYTTPVQVNLSAAAFSETLPAVVGGATITVPASAATGTGGVTNIRNVVGGRAGDILVGDNLPNQLEGRDGNDILFGQGGDDFLLGGLGADILFGGDGNDSLDGLTGEVPATPNAPTTPDAAQNFLFGGNGNDVLFARSATDQLFGDAGFDRLVIRSCTDFFAGSLGLNTGPDGGTITTLDLAIMPQTGAAATLPPTPLLLSPLDCNQTLIGSVPPAAIAAAAGSNVNTLPGRFLASAENKSNLVRGYYQRFLGRTAEAAGLQNWLSAFAAGAQSEDVLAAIIGSDEYFARLGNDAARFIRSLYTDLLGRGPTDAEVAAWVNNLSTTSRGSVARVFTTSDEFRANLIQSWYGHYLGRTADPAGLQAWLAAMRNGATQDQVQDAVLGSAEYRQSASRAFTFRQGDSTAAYVRSLYVKVLGRAVSEAEVAGWLAVL